MSAAFQHQGTAVRADAEMSRPHPLAALADEPWRHDFYQALRNLETHYADKPRLGTARKPADEMLRLGQTPDLSFPPATLSAVHFDEQTGQARLEVRFFGLFGPHGPLPTHLTEFALERLKHHSDPTFARFADMFHHRLLLLFYRAWAQAQPTVNLDRPHDDHFADQVGSLIGLGTPNHRDRDAAPDYAKLYFSGFLSHQARNADGLRAMLSAYLRSPVRIEPFTGQWLTLQPAERSRLGRPGADSRMPTSQLGAGAVLGSRVFDRQHNFRIEIGLLTLAEFEALLPGGSALPAVQALVRHYVGIELSWDLHLRLDPAERPACRPGHFGRLGWTTWIGQRDANAGCPKDSRSQRPGQPEPVLTLRPGIRLTAHHNGAARRAH